MGKESGKRPAAKEPDINALAAWIVALAKESDRGCLLVAHAMLDDALEILLRSMFAWPNKREPTAVECGEWLLRNKTEPVLGGFYRKLEVAFALGKITVGTRTALKAFNTLRNNHGHGITPFSFSLPAVRAIRSSLTDSAKKHIADRSETIISEICNLERAELVITTTVLWSLLLDAAKYKKRQA